MIQMKEYAILLFILLAIGFVYYTPESKDSTNKKWRNLQIRRMFLIGMVIVGGVIVYMEFTNEADMQSSTGFLQTLDGCKACELKHPETKGTALYGKLPTPDVFNDQQRGKQIAKSLSNACNNCVNQCDRITQSRKRAYDLSDKSSQRAKELKRDILQLEQLCTKYKSNADDLEVASQLFD